MLIEKYSYVKSAKKAMLHFVYCYVLKHNNTVFYSKLLKQHSLKQQREAEIFNIKIPIC